MQQTTQTTRPRALLRAAGGPARAVLLATLLLAAAVGLSDPGTGARAATSQPGRRVTVALYGDSVTESLLIPNFLHKGFAPQLASSLRAFGFSQGGTGFIPAASYIVHFNKFRSYNTGTVPPDGWTTIGDELLPGYDGPSGYSAVATSPDATATITVNDPDIDVLFTSTSASCLFTVTAAGQTFTFDTYRPGPTADTPASLTLPPGQHQLVIHGPNCGLLEFDGIFEHEPVPPGKVQVEVDNLGHAAKLPWVDFQPRVQALLAAEKYNISVFNYGYLAELFVKGRLPQVYVDAMVARAKIATANGGACVVVQPTPIQVAPSQVTNISKLDKLIAQRGGCQYSTVWAHLWPSASYAVNHNLLLLDGTHPTAAGYTLMTKALAPVVAAMIDKQLGRPAPTTTS